jgi:predicted RNA-binding Zn-ribbon protein involved in translation (DUF1610 family)
MSDEQGSGAAAPARLTFPCGACGAELQFAIGAAALRCPYCGHSETIPASGEEIVEQPFDEAAVARAPVGWGTALKEFACQMCGARHDVEAHVTSTSCPFCGSAQVEEQAARADRLRPGSLVPFQLPRERVGELFRQWLRGLWFRPNALKRLAVSDAVRGVYIPYWTFDALTHSHWRAEAGYYYYESETYTEKNAQGQVVTKTRQVRRTRWERVSGTHSAFFDDVLVPASQGIDRGLARRLGFDTKALVPYQPQYLVGLSAEEYQLDVRAAWPEAKDEMGARIRAACARKVPGDTQRNLSVSTSYHNRTFKLCLLPMWVATYRFGGKSWRYLCNGQTGQVQGRAPISWPKVLAFAAALVAIAVVILLLAK